MGVWADVDSLSGMLFESSPSGTSREPLGSEAYARTASGSSVEVRRKFVSSCNIDTRVAGETVCESENIQLAENFGCRQ